MRLVVELYGVRIGILSGDARTFDIEVTNEAIEAFGFNSAVLSVIMPLHYELRRDHAARRRNWFAELLPEGDLYSYMLQRGKLKEGDTLGFLARFGRDIAGALQIWNPDLPGEPRTPRQKPLTRVEIRKLLEDPIGHPLANDPRAGKSSLAGVQPKIVLTSTENGWAQALDGFPTTHILKPQLQGPLASMIYDEEYGSRLARRLGLATFQTQIEVFDGLPALVIERYDRDGYERIHQEDFNQILNARGDQKYQEMGGVVNLKRIAEATLKHTSRRELSTLARMITFAVAIGNLDLHTKNLSMLHPQVGTASLAPAYDVVPQVHFPNDGRMALAVNGKYHHADISRDDLEAEFESWGIHNPAALIAALISDLQNALEEENPLDGSFPELRQQIHAFTQRLIA